MMARNQEAPHGAIRARQEVCAGRVVITEMERSN